MSLPNDPEAPGPRRASDVDDQHWLDLLAGRPAPAADAGTGQQAAWLRAALLQHRVAAPAGSPAPADERAARLLQRARAAGLLPGEGDRGGGAADDASAARSAAQPGAAQVSPSGAVHVSPVGAAQLRTTGGRAANQWRYAVAACVAAGAAVLVWLPERSADDGAASSSGTLRGAALQRVEAVDPAQRRQQLLQSLRDAGFDAQAFDRLGRPGIDIALPVPLPPAQAAALLRLGLQPTAGPSLQVELVAPRTPPQTPLPTPAPAR